MKLLVAILLVAFATQAYSQLQCYVCEDCEEIDTDKATAVTCEVPTTTTEDTSTVTGDENTGTGSSIASGDTTTPGETTPEPNDSSSDPNENTDTSTPVTGTGEPEVTDKPEGTDEPEDTDAPEVTDAPEGTDEPEDTDAPEGTDEPEGTDDPDPEMKLKLMAKQQLNDPRIIPHVFRQRRQATAPEFRCYKVEVADGENIKVNRGCIEYTTSDDATCKSIYEEEPKNCDLCNENECNSSSMIVASLLAIVASILITSRLL